MDVLGLPLVLGLVVAGRVAARDDAQRRHVLGQAQGFADRVHPGLIRVCGGPDSAKAQGFGGKADYSDPTFKMMVMSGADAPLRAAVLMGGGTFTVNVAEGLLAMANGQPLQGLKKMGGK